MIFRFFLILTFTLVSCSDNSFRSEAPASKSKSSNYSGKPSASPQPEPSPEGFRPDPIPVFNFPPTAQIPIEEACASSSVNSYRTTLQFSPDTTQCEWGVNGNLEKTGFTNVIAAQQMYMKTIRLNNNIRSICSFSIDALSEFSVFDDDITFIFEGYAVAGDYMDRSYLKDVIDLAEENSLLKHDSSRFIGKRFPGSPSQWKEDGIEGSFTTRQNSDRQREGKIDISITERFVEKLPVHIQSKGEYDFGFAISGNTNSTDCTHSGFEFEINIRYLNIQ